MIFRNICIFPILILFNFSLYCQNNNGEKKGSIIFDVFKFPVFKLDSVENKIKVTYFTLTEVEVSTRLQFNGGYEALSLFCDSIYFKEVDANLIELNAKALYTIFFDKELNIKDIKIIKRIGYDNKKINYDNLIVDILKKTEPHWIKLDNDANYFFYSGSFKLR